MSPAPKILSAPPVADVPAAIARFHAIEAELPPNDGIVWFTRLYRSVTEAVHAKLGKQKFADPACLARLDVVFVNLYLDALRAWASAQAKAPRAWAPLFAARSTPRIAPIQFALAGMNAHINRDLPVAIVTTWQELRLELREQSPEHDDYLKVNTLLAQTEKKVKRWFDTGFVGIVDSSLGSADDRIAMWNVGRARDAAWVQGEALWALRGAGFLERRYLETLDHLVGFAGRGLLVPLP
ncbi:MAG: DUF5995 family protein [Gaiellaceae bacterium]